MDNMRTPPGEGNVLYPDYLRQNPWCDVVLQFSYILPMGGRWVAEGTGGHDTEGIKFNFLPHNSVLTLILKYHLRCISTYSVTKMG